MPMLDAGLLGSRREICEERIASGAEGESPYHSVHRDNLTVLEKDFDDEIYREGWGVGVEGG